MDLNRRDFLLGGASLAVFLLSPIALARAPNDFPEVLGAWRVGSEDYAGTWSPIAGARGIKVPGRAHEVLQHPHRLSEAVAIGRRPGQFIFRFDIARSEVMQLRMAETMRQFNGHAAFSSDGELLYTSEHDLVSGVGLVGVRRADTLEKIEELPSHGTAPHGILMSSDGTLLIANGGFLTIPKVGVEEEAPGANTPSLVHLSADGKLLGQWHLEDRFLSIRHMSRAKNGTVGVALQAAHSTQVERDKAPVLAIFNGDRLILPPVHSNPSVGGYAGDIACVSDHDDEYFALGCSHSGLIGFWNKEGLWKGSTILTRACAVAGFDHSILSITEQGQRMRVYKPGSATSTSIGLFWENHMAVLKTAAV